MKIKFSDERIDVEFPIDRLPGIFPWPSGTSVNTRITDDEIKDAMTVLAGELARRQEAADAAKPIREPVLCAPNTYCNHIPQCNEKRAAADLAVARCVKTIDSLDGVVVPCNERLVNGECPEHPASVAGVRHG